MTDLTLTYRFVTNLTVGRRVQLFYLRVGCWAGNNVQKQALPYLHISLDELIELEKTAPIQIYKSPFRFVREPTSYQDMEWIT